MSKKFILLTPGRSGSTSLMDVLEEFENVAVPNKNIECENNELLHPRFVSRHKNQYEDLCKCKINTNRELMDQFFLYNKNYDYAGFKSMPVRHRDDPGFLLRADIKYIILIREDIPSTVASFLAANLSNSWDRRGENRSKKIRISGLDYFMVLGNTFYIRRSMEMIKQINNPINIKYEDLCNLGYQNPTLDQFFDQPITLKNPRPPTSGADYVEDWGRFQKFVEGLYHFFDVLFRNKLVK